MTCCVALIVSLASGVALTSGVAQAATTTLYVATTGSDTAVGSRSQPLRTVSEAWQRIPVGASKSWRIRIGPGNYSSVMPEYWENRSGQIVLEATNPRRPPVLGSMNVYRVNGLQLRNLRLVGGGDVFHCEQCRKLLIDHVTLVGQDAQETVKINQSWDVTIRNSDLSGATDNAFDAVAVQGLQLLGNRIHGAVDWCGYAKGGSTRVVVRGNVFYDCGTGGFTVGQGTGFQFMQAPFLQYEASGVLIEGNTVHDVEGAAFGVQGGYNVLLRRNVATRVGARSHVLEVVFGLRSCDGQPGDDGRERCAAYLAAGGWGTTVVDDGTNAVEIPNRRVFLYDNVIVNPDQQPSQWQIFDIRGPTPTHEGSNVPASARADDELRLVGNVIWDGGPGFPLGIADDACPRGSLCDPAMIDAENSINTSRPTLTAQPGGRLVVPSLERHTPPPPNWSDRPAGTPVGWTNWPK